MGLIEEVKEVVDKYNAMLPAESRCERPGRCDPECPGVKVELGERFLDEVEEILRRHGVDYDSDGEAWTPWSGMGFWHHEYDIYIRFEHDNARWYVGFTGRCGSVRPPATVNTKCYDVIEGFYMQREDDP